MRRVFDWDEKCLCMGQSRHATDASENEAAQTGLKRNNIDFCFPVVFQKFVLLFGRIFCPLGQIKTMIPVNGTVDGEISAENIDAGPPKDKLRIKRTFAKFRQNEYHLPYFRNELMNGNYSRFVRTAFQTAPVAKEPGALEAFAFGRTITVNPASLIRNAKRAWRLGRLPEAFNAMRRTTSRAAATVICSCHSG